MGFKTLQDGGGEIYLDVNGESPSIKVREFTGIKCRRDAFLALSNRELLIAVGCSEMLHTAQRPGFLPMPSHRFAV